MKLSQYGVSEILIAGVMGFSLVVGIFLAILWLIWLLWTFVLFSIWPEGPQALVSPNYWLFVCEWLLLGLIGRRIFGRNKKEA